MNQEADYDAVVLGAGAVGVCCALSLQKQGKKVLLIDRMPPGAGTSMGNAGVISRGSVMPVSTPGLWKALPKHLFNPMGPVKMRWGYAPKLLPFAWQMFKRRKHWQEDAVGQNALLDQSYMHHEALVNEAGVSDLMYQSGWMKLFESAESFEGSENERQTLDRFSVRYQVMNGDALRDMEPALGGDIGENIHRALWINDTAAIRDPRKLVEAYFDLFVKHGGRFMNANIEGLDTSDSEVVRVNHSLGQTATSQVVVAMGAFSGAIAARLGVKAKLDTERGYHAMFENDGPALNRPLLMADRGFVLAPMLEGVRLTAPVEMGGLKAPPNYNFVLRFKETARRILPGLSTKEKSVWMGYRPSMPDTLPVIGPSPKDPRVILAYGHGHVGLTQSAITGHLVGQIAQGVATNLDLKPYDPARKL